MNWTERLLKNHFRNIRHHLHLEIQTRIMLKTKVIFTSLVIGFLAFESCHAFFGPFYRPTMLQPFLQERRFGKVPAIIKDARLQRHHVSYPTTQATTKTTTKIQTVKNPKLQKVQRCHFKTFSILSCLHYYSL